MARLTNVPAGSATARRSLSSDDAKKLLASATEDRLGAFVVAVLRERRVLQDEERAAAGARWSEDWAAEELVFTTANGRPVDASNLRWYFRQACTRAAWAVDAV